MFLLHPPRATRRILFTGVAVGVLASGSTFAASTALAASANVETLETVAAASASAALIGANVTLSNVDVVHGRDVQIGAFSGLALSPDVPAGLALTTGSLRAADPSAAADVDFTRSALTGPNAKLTTTGDLGGVGSAELTELIGATTYDAAQVALTVIPAGNTLSIVYQFGSEEYASWADQDYTDAIGIFVNGTLCSVVGDQPAGIATVGPTAQTASFVANFDDSGPLDAYDTEMNGFSTALTCTATVEPGAPATIVAGVADTVDGQLDTTLLLAAGGITSSAPAVSTPDPSESATPTPTPSAVTGSVAGSSGGATRANATGALALTGGDATALVAAIAGGAVLAAVGTGLVIRARRRADDAAGEL